jgi:hypothetical protein
MIFLYAVSLLLYSLFSNFEMRLLLHLSALWELPCLSATVRERRTPSSKGRLEDLQSTGSISATTVANQEFLATLELNDTDVYMTTNFGTPMDDAVNLKAGIRCPTLLEDFIFGKSYSVLITSL